MTTLDQITAVLGWCALINVVLLLVSSVAVMICRQQMTRMHAKMFGLGEDELARAYFRYLGNFKIAVIVFSLVPYLALKIVG